ncbi:type VII secretion target [Mycolicibacterium rutilum]|nr:type VII secretion target [Mycolicibacterium rutilum]
MAATLRVDPSKLREVAATQTEVGSFVSSMGTGTQLATAAAAVTELQSAAACQLAAEVLDKTAAVVGKELATHAERLTSAAERYTSTDQALAQRLRSIAE